MFWICFTSYTVYHTDMFCLYNLIAFVNSKGDSPIYIYLDILFIYMYVINIYIINKHVYPTPRPTQKKDRQVLHGPYTGPIPSLGEYFPSPPVPSIENTTPEPKKLEWNKPEDSSRCGGGHKKRKKMSRTPMFGLPKNPEQKVEDLERLNYY